MTTAIDIIHASLEMVGGHSHVMPADPSVMNRSLIRLKTALETLKGRQIILEETVSGVTTTVSTPTNLTSELNEPDGATDHLIKYLSADLAPIAGVPITPDIRSYKQAGFVQLSLLYSQYTIDKKVPSGTLSMGQGNTGIPSRSAFFSGKALAND